MAELDFKKWFVGERAKALAMVLLTRRDDLQIRETNSDTGLDYTVRIKSEDGVRLRVFGVLMRASMSPVTIEGANAQLKLTVEGLVAGKVLMPVCIF